MLAVDAALVPLAALMAAAIAGLVKAATEARSAERAGAVLFLLVMMVEMFVGALVYYLHPGTTGLVVGLWLSGGLMSLSVFPLVFSLLRLTRPRLDAAAPMPAPLARPTGAYVGAIVGLVLVNEFLMGWTFQMASGVSLPALTAGSAGSLNLLANVVASPWFLFTMAAEMLLAAFLLRDRLDRPLSIVLAFQAVIMFLSPPALSLGSWVFLSILMGSGAMIALIIYLMEFVYRNKQLNVSFAAYSTRLLAIYALMMAGLFVWAYYGPTLVFAISVVLEMVLFFAALLGPQQFITGDRMPWQLNAKWAFQLLLFIFIAEVFMGAILDLQIEPAFYGGSFPALALSGPPLHVIANALFNGFWFLTLVTGSTWFLAMMGGEMGALVYFKLRETRVLETRIRLVLMMGCFGAFAVFFPSIYYSAIFPNLPSGASVPFLGWSMGVGSAPLANSVFLVVILTYVATGALSALFGRRAICSTFCTAALMFQGTTIDSMSTFNRTSHVGRKYLGSRFSTVYSVTMGVVLVSLAGTSLLSYLNQVGVLTVTVLGADPTVFFFAFSFGVLWYVLFVTIPYVGNYNCVAMGWCYTGIIAGAFSRIGFFKLKVKDRTVCQRCTTLDCAKACPIGLVDMPGHFRTEGEFRSSKCCGVGNCVGACPYENIYIHDVRHWIRRRLHLPEAPKEVRLPMLSIGARGTLRPARVVLSGTVSVASTPALASGP